MRPHILIQDVDVERGSVAAAGPGAQRGSPSLASSSQLHKFLEADLLMRHRAGRGSAAWPYLGELILSSGLPFECCSLEAWSYSQLLSAPVWPSTAWGPPSRLYAASTCARGAGVAVAAWLQGGLPHISKAASTWHAQHAQLTHAARRAWRTPMMDR